VTDDQVFGPLVVLGPGDHAARLTPLTDTDADALIRSVRAAPLLPGQRGDPATDLDTLRELLLRVSRLADDLPEVAELDLSPVIARPHGVFAMDARIKVAPCPPQDPFLRKLR
jgi:acyl-CoA synthetase (NDP forming)